MDNTINKTNNDISVQMRKVGFFMNIVMGITMSLILSVHGVLGSGHFSVPSLAISIAISCILALCIGFFLPVRPAREKATAKMKIPVKILVGNIITNLFYVLIITSVLTTVMITMARHGMDMNNVPASVPRPSVLKALPRSLLSSFVVSYVITLILEPLYLKIAFKKYGIQPPTRESQP